MMFSYRFAAIAGLAFVSCALMAGCAEEKKGTKPSGGASAMEGETDDATKIKEAIAMLPEAERAAAEAQKTCPVGGEALGSMGMPFKVTVKGRDVYLCCEGCKGAIESDPDKYLAKLPPAAP